MKLVSINLDAAPPLADGEIEFGRGLPAQAPQRVKREDAVQSLRDLADEERAAAQEIAVQSQILAEARAAASELQSQYQEMVEAESNLSGQLKLAVQENETNNARLAELHRHFKANFSSRMADALHESLRRSHMVPVFKEVISELTAELERLRSRIAEFRREHGVGE